MESKTVILSNGVEIPCIGVGTFGLAKFDMIKTVRNSLKYGYSCFDTASAYGNERWLGLSLKLSFKKRSDYFIITKISNVDQRTKDVKTALNESLERLGLDYIDLYLMHWPQTDTFIETWKQMEELYLEGKVKAIGVSNFHEHHLKELFKIAKIKPMVNEIELHPLLSQKKLVDFCRENDIKIISYSPFARMDKNLIDNETLNKLSIKYKKSVPQIILRWNIQHGYIPIPKTSKKERLKSNINIFDFSIDENDMSSIDKLNKNYRVRYDPDNCDFSKL